MFPVFEVTADALYDAISDFLRGSSSRLPESDSVRGGVVSTADGAFAGGFEKKWKSVFVSGLAGEGSVFCRFFARPAIARRVFYNIFLVPPWIGVAVVATGHL